VSNIEYFAIEENASNSNILKISIEGGLAWYEIKSVHPSYTSIFVDMQLKARIWCWIQRRRSSIVSNNASARSSWPSLKMLYRDLPDHFKLRYRDPIDAFHPYIIERIIQSDLFGEALLVGPEGIQPEWMQCKATRDLAKKYPVRPQIELTSGCLAIRP
jgi:hypothetical protein